MLTAFSSRPVVLPDVLDRTLEHVFHRTEEFVHDFVLYLGIAEQIAVLKKLSHFIGKVVGGGVGAQLDESIYLKLHARTGQLNRIVLNVVALGLLRCGLSALLSTSSGRSRRPKSARSSA